MRKNSILILIIIWTAVIALSFVWNRHVIVKNNQELALKKSQSFFNQILITRYWNSSHGGVYVPVTEETQPNPYLDDSLRDLTATNGMKLTKINPAYMTRQIAEINQIKDDIKFHITSLKPIRPANEADPWEKVALQLFEDGETEIFERVRNQNEEEFRYMAPLKVEESCLACHAHQGYKLGETRGGISISFPSKIYTASQNKAITYMFFIHLMAYSLGLSGMFAYNKMSTKLYSIIAEKNARLEKDRILLKESNKALTQTIAEKDKFFSIVAHDLKSPFYGLVGLSDVLVEKINEKDFKDTEKFAGFISDSAKKTFDLTVNLLDWAQAQTGGMAFNPELLNIGLLIKEAVEVFKSNANQKQISLKTNIPEKVLVNADKAMINAAVRNLISNAVKFTKKGGEIFVSVETKGNEVFVSVQDNGIGMSESMQKDLFQIDKEISRPGTENEPSTGLGLFLVKEFVEKNGGTIMVKSKEGHGSKFSFNLPEAKA